MTALADELPACKQLECLQTPAGFLIPLSCKPSVGTGADPTWLTLHQRRDWYDLPPRLVKKGGKKPERFVS